MVYGLEITDVIVFPVRNKPPKAKTLAFCRVILNDQFIINGVQVIEGKNGNFVQMPRQTSEHDNRKYDICFPTSGKLRAYLNNTIIEQYNIVTQSYKTAGDQ